MDQTSDNNQVSPTGENKVFQGAGHTDRQPDEEQGMVNGTSEIRDKYINHELVEKIYTERGRHLINWLIYLIVIGATWPSKLIRHSYFKVQHKRNIAEEYRDLEHRLVSVIGSAFVVSLSSIAGIFYAVISTVPEQFKKKASENVEKGMPVAPRLYNSFKRFTGTLRDEKWLAGKIFSGSIKDSDAAKYNTNKTEVNRSENEQQGEVNASNKGVESDEGNKKINKYKEIYFVFEAIAAVVLPLLFIPWLTPLVLLSRQMIRVLQWKDWLIILIATVGGLIAISITYIAILIFLPVTIFVVLVVPLARASYYILKYYFEKVVPFIMDVIRKMNIQSLFWIVVASIFKIIITLGVPIGVGLVVLGIAGGAAAIVVIMMVSVIIAISPLAGIIVTLPFEIPYWIFFSFFWLVHKFRYVSLVSIVIFFFMLIFILLAWLIWGIRGYIRKNNSLTVDKWLFSKFSGILSATVIGCLAIFGTFLIANRIDLEEYVAPPNFPEDYELVEVLGGIRLGLDADRIELSTPSATVPTTTTTTTTTIVPYRLTESEDECISGEEFYFGGGCVPCEQNSSSCEAPAATIECSLSEFQFGGGCVPCELSPESCLPPGVQCTDSEFIFGGGCVPCDVNPNACSVNVTETEGRGNTGSHDNELSEPQESSLANEIN